MPRAIGNSIAEIVSAPGTGAFTLGTAAPGCALFASAKEADGTAIGNGDLVSIGAWALDANGNPNGDREIVDCTFTAGAPNTLARTTILESTNGGAAVNFTGNVRIELIEFATHVASRPLFSFPGTAAPATPTEGNRLFSRNRAGRDILAERGASGAIREIMPQLGQVSQRYLIASAALSPANTVGLTAFAVGTSTARNISASPMFNTAVRIGYVSAATAASSAGVRQTTNGAACLRGGAAGLGGFYMICRFGTAAFTSDGRLFVGMAPVAAIASVDPSTLASIIGVGCDAADSNLQIMSNDATGLATKVNLGANFPGKTANTDLYELRLFCLPNGSSVQWSVERLNTGDLASGTITASADLPAATTLLGPILNINNGATAAAVAIDLLILYLETPV